MQLHIQPSEFWKLPPRHFWMLAETLREDRTKPRFTDGDREALRDMLNGNDHGGFW